jgi:transposase
MINQGRKAGMDDIREVLRTFKAEGTIKGTARTLTCARGTVRRYVRWAEDLGYLGGAELPEAGELAKAWGEREQVDAAVRAKLHPFRDDIEGWLNQKISLVRIQDMLVERHGWGGSYNTLKRFTEPMRDTGESFVRIETAPGAEAQVDFGLMGMVWDPEERRERKGWLFLMTLSNSRHMYGEIVFRQDLPTWIMCHTRAFEWFGGVPKKLTIDNLKAGIVNVALYDFLANRTYVEQAEHCKFMISPCRPRMPRHKGKVESGVKYVRNAFFVGRPLMDLAEVNRALKAWIMEKAGLRIHGTTKMRPLEAFLGMEKAFLLPLPESPFEMTEWKEATVHADCHISVLGSYYSVPYRLRGQRVTVKLTHTMARIYLIHELVATHIRAGKKGTWRTVLAHYPPEKVVWLESTPAWCMAEAERTGPGTQALVRELLGRPSPLDHLRRVQGILGLKKKWGRERVEAACSRAHRYGVYTYGAVKNILEQGLDGPVAVEGVAEVIAPSYKFARPMSELLAHLPAKEG